MSNPMLTDASTGPPVEPPTTGPATGELNPSQLTGPNGETLTDEEKVRVLTRRMFAVPVLRRVLGQLFGGDPGVPSAADMLAAEAAIRQLYPNAPADAGDVR
jgi:hypothetical protein